MVCCSVRERKGACFGSLPSEIVNVEFATVESRFFFLFFSFSFVSFFFFFFFFLVFLFLGYRDLVHA